MRFWSKTLFTKTRMYSFIYKCNLTQSIKVIDSSSHSSFEFQNVILMKSELNLGLIKNLAPGGTIANH